jgi:hypothetical protein
MCRSEEQAELEILAYLVDNPEAQDTLEGIVEWWLLDRGILNRTAEVRAALAELMSKRLIVERKDRDARSHYRVNQQKSRDIEFLLQQKSE